MAFRRHKGTVAYLQHGTCTKGREKWDGAVLHTRGTSLALGMSRTVSGLYLKLVLHPVDRMNDGQSEKNSAAYISRFIFLCHCCW